MKLMLQAVCGGDCDLHKCCFRSGWAAMSVMLVMSLLGAKAFRHANFALFYRVHILFALLFVATALMHGVGSQLWSGHMPKVIPGALFWIIDLIIRACTLNCASQVDELWLHIKSTDLMLYILHVEHYLPCVCTCVCDYVTFCAFACLQTAQLGIEAYRCDEHKQGSHAPCWRRRS